MAVILSVFQAKKSIGPRVLFSNLSFGLHKGDRVGLVGPNGSGKSSLLKILAGFDDADVGSVVWSQNQKRVYVAQSPRAEYGKTVREFLSTSAELDQKSESYAWELMAKLGSETIDWEVPLQQLSGGEQKKLQLVEAFLQRPDVVLMDEPTNHLDVESIQMLEDFLESVRDITFLIISHDRFFLQNVVQEVMDLDARYKDGYLRIRGGYAEYLEASREMFRAQQVTQDRLENDLRREVEWLRRGAIARLKKQKARQDATYELMDTVDEYSELNRKRTLDIQLKTEDRIPKKLIEIEDLSLKIEEREIINHLNLVISRGSRIGLLGKNGCGKSTLIQALLGKTGDGIKIQGKVSRFDELKYSYFEQQRGALEFDKSLLHNLCPMGDYVHVHGQPMHVRSYLDRFRFRRDQHDLKVKELSGGEQNRLLIAKLMTEKVQLMILDEPTNDLDFETLQSLKKSLMEFDGAVILVSHDRAFMDEVCDQLLYFNPETAEIESYASFFQWTQRDKNIEAKRYKTNEAKKKDSVSNLSESKAQDLDTELNTKNLSLKTNTAFDGDSPGENTSYQAAKPKKKLSYKDQRELDTMEETILEMESRLTDMQRELNLPHVQVDSSKLVQLSTTIAELEAAIENKYKRWQDLSS